MSKQIEHDFRQHKHGRKAGSGKALFATSKYGKVHPAHPIQNGVGDIAFGVAELDRARLHVKLLAIRRTPRLQSPM
jgi:hypothetical protein